jgi:hypothetical protein
VNDGLVHLHPGRALVIVEYVKSGTSGLRWKVYFWWEKRRSWHGKTAVFGCGLKEEQGLREDLFISAGNNLPSWTILPLVLAKNGLPNVGVEVRLSQPSGSEMVELHVRNPRDHARSLYNILESAPWGIQWMDFHDLLVTSLRLIHAQC